jgi:hypothetical protein
MAEQFSVQLADSFEKVITPTFSKMNDSLDTLVNSVTRCQQDAVKEILDTFMKEMRGSFQLEFNDFNESLERLKQAQKENAEYTTNMYKTMGRQLNELYLDQEKSVKDSMDQLVTLQNRYLATASRIAQDNQSIQKMQQQDYQHVVQYMKEAEQSASRFWVACNQTMKRYVEAASHGMENVTAASQASTDVLKANRRMVDEFDQMMKEFVEYQKLSYQTMEQVRRLLADVSAAGTRDVYLTGGRNASTAQKETLSRIQRLLEEQGENQQALLEEISGNVKDLSKAAQKGKFSLFK